MACEECAFVFGANHAEEMHDHIADTPHAPFFHRFASLHRDAIQTVEGGGTVDAALYARHGLKDPATLSGGASEEDMFLAGGFGFGVGSKVARLVLSLMRLLSRAKVIVASWAATRALGAAVAAFLRKWSSFAKTLKEGLSGDALKSYNEMMWGAAEGGVDTVEAIIKKVPGLQTLVASARALFGKYAGIFVDWINRGWTASLKLATQMGARAEAKGAMPTFSSSVNWTWEQVKARFTTLIAWFRAHLTSINTSEWGKYVSAKAHQVWDPITKRYTAVRDDIIGRASSAQEALIKLLQSKMGASMLAHLFIVLSAGNALLLAPQLAADAAQTIPKLLFTMLKIFRPEWRISRSERVKKVIVHCTRIVGGLMAFSGLATAGAVIKVGALVGVGASSVGLVLVLPAVAIFLVSEAVRLYHGNSTSLFSMAMSAVFKAFALVWKGLVALFSAGGRLSSGSRGSGSMLSISDDDSVFSHSRSRSPRKRLTRGQELRLERLRAARKRARERVRRRTATRVASIRGRHG